ncbi:transposase, partial [Jhaorihella thermophila]
VSFTSALTPEIMNTDQGSQFTSFAWTDRLRRSCVRVSTDGKGRFLDSIFVERLWEGLKYECVYLHAWETGSEARTGVGKWIEFYNRKRPHSALGGETPSRGLLAEKRRNPTRSAGAKSSLNQAGNCPDIGE